ncbi:hypothetical protein M514_25777 [Trichuris suis]|uniref:PDZ domain-containing protein n=1 Tax=Trichuris suis TaxID=68888 RepID=A0A085MXW2_9BILA|nr:hypothetical protein M514_25777 [Trichuris suis]
MSARSGGKSGWLIIIRIKYNRKVNRTSLIGLRHVEALDCLLNSGEVLQLTLARYHPESKTYKHLVEMASQKISRSSQQLSCGTCIQADLDNQLQGNGERTNQPGIKAGKLSSKTLQEWETICGPEYKILLVKLERSPYNETLGIALEGTVDVVDESETCPHHFIRSVEPNNGIKVLSGELKPGDELLEVNNEVLYGRSYVEVLEILQSLPRQVTMTVGRNTLAAPLNNGLLGAVTSYITKPDGAKQMSHAHKRKLRCSTIIKKAVLGKAGRYRPLGAGEAKSSDFARAQEELMGSGVLRWIPAYPFMTDWTGALQSTASAVQSSQLRQNGVDEFHYPSTKENRNISRRTIIWSPYIEKVLLVKGKEGLGFSIFECKAFSDHNAIAIVVYSVICNSVADKSGQLFPGDRLVSVNNLSMTNVRLEEAIGILKSVPEGPVVLEISKPLSLSSEEFANPQNVQVDYYEPTEQRGGGEGTESSLRGKEFSLCGAFGAALGSSSGLCYDNENVKSW